MNYKKNVQKPKKPRKPRKKTLKRIEKDRRRANMIILEDAVDYVDMITKVNGEDIVLNPTDGQSQSFEDRDNDIYYYYLDKISSKEHLDLDFEEVELIFFEEADVFFLKEQMLFL